MPPSDQPVQRAQPSIALAINTRNEERHLPDALASAAGVDEIVVADMQSTDRTVEICRAAGARVFSVPNYGYCEPARQALVDATTADWVLVLDADERLSEGGVDMLRKVAHTSVPDIAAFLLPRRTFLGPIEVKGTGWSAEKERHPRFFRNHTVSWPTRIHAVPEFTGAVQDLPIGTNVTLEHRCFDDLTEAWRKFNTYSAVEAGLLRDSGHVSTWAEGLRESIQEMSRRYQPEVDGGVSFALSFGMFFYRLAVHLKNIELSGNLPEEPVPTPESLVAAWQAFLLQLQRQELKRYLSEIHDIVTNQDGEAGPLLAISSRASEVLGIAHDILPDTGELQEVSSLLASLRDHYGSFQSELEDLRASRLDSQRAIATARQELDLLRAALGSVQARHDDAVARLRDERDLSADLYRDLSACGAHCQCASGLATHRSETPWHRTGHR